MERPIFQRMNLEHLCSSHGLPLFVFYTLQGRGFVFLLSLFVLFSDICWCSVTQSCLIRCSSMDCGTPGFLVLQPSLVLHCPKLCIFKSQTLIQDLCPSLIQNGLAFWPYGYCFKSDPQWSLCRKHQKRFSTPLSNGMESLAHNLTDFHLSTPHGSLLAL